VTVTWVVEIGDEFKLEFFALQEDVRTEILALTRLLQQFGPQLGRPRVDTLNGSRHANMKELRAGAADGEWRVAFAFDTNRKAILLVAGDKSGIGEKRFYRELIRRTDDRFDAHLARLRRERKCMPTNVDDIIGKLRPAQRKKVEARAARLIAEEMTLRELRHARKLTQVRMAKALGITQDSVSRLEKRSDLLLSTLRKTVEAMGGNLSLIAEFPDRAPVVLSGIAEVDPAPRPTDRKHPHAHV
jgi:DNA-binding XRE family transcriptional regulator